MARCGKCHLVFVLTGLLVLSCARSLANDPPNFDKPISHASYTLENMQDFDTVLFSTLLVEIRKAGYLVKSLGMQNLIAYGYSSMDLTLSYPFEAYTSYIVIAKGDGIIVRDLDASISDRNGRVLTRDVELDNIPMLTFSPRYSGSYNLRFWEDGSLPGILVYAIGEEIKTVDHLAGELVWDRTLTMMGTLSKLAVKSGVAMVEIQMNTIERTRGWEIARTLPPGDYGIVVLGDGLWVEDVSLTVRLPSGTAQVKREANISYAEFSLRYRSTITIEIQASKVSVSDLGFYILAILKR